MHCVQKISQLLHALAPTCFEEFLIFLAVRYRVVLKMICMFYFW